MKKLILYIQNLWFLFLGIVAPKKMADKHFYRSFGRHIDWENPKDLNEKINWLKFHSNLNEWARLADKFLVRDYVKERGCGSLLVELYGSWDKPDDIEWNLLPNRFIIKTNNGSGKVFICEDKSTLDIKQTIKDIRQMMKRHFADFFVEPHYKLIKPCIIAEELLYVEKQSAKSTSIVDYKIWCFNGKPAYVLIILNRTGSRMNMALYDIDWNNHSEYIVENHHYERMKEPVPMPSCWKQMVDAAAILSKGLPQVRVDLYENDGKPYFGELTLTSASGLHNYFTQEFLRILGDMCVIEK